MHYNSILISALVSAYVNAIPLNINLGAYSPALVVGDGEISFGGKQDVSNLMNALEGAAVNGAAAAAVQSQPQVAPAATVTGLAQAQATQTAPVQEDQSAQITALQGLGKDIAPRVVELVKTDKEKRDINGFNAALKYAADAIKTSPLIQLGTGEGGSGVGIKQNPGISAAQPADTAEKVVLGRDEPVSPKMKTTVTTMFIRGGPVPEAARSVNDGSSVEKRAPSQEIDGVNLNMAEGQVAELTFVEARAVGSQED